MATEVLTTTSGAEQDWTVPAGVTLLTSIECWGPGAGGGTLIAGGGGGGGGGEYAITNSVAVTPGNVHKFFIDTSPAAGANGQATYFKQTSSSTKLCDAEPGSTTATATGGAGGTGGVGDTTYAGGAGGNGSGSDAGGGGGSSAGTGAVGGAGLNGVLNTGGNGGTAPAGGADGGNGGNAGANGSAGSNYGGGGGGCGDVTHTGGAGTQGKIVLTYTITPSLATYRLSQPLDPIRMKPEMVASD